MQNKTTANFNLYSQENRGRVVLLFLLFLLAIYNLIFSGYNSFAIVCISPLIVLFVYAAFKWKMFTFWILITVNYFIQMKDISEHLPLPMSVPNEMLQIILLAIAIIDTRQSHNFGRAVNLMFFALLIWCGFCTLEVLNDTCGLGINISAWYTGARLMAFQLLYTFLVFSIYINSPEVLIKYLKIWIGFALFSAFWTWKQKNLGFTAVEGSWIQGSKTHILNAGTLIRYFSTFSDAANYGCNAAATIVAFVIFAITTPIKKYRYSLFAISAFILVGMFDSGTRTAIFCMIAGFIVYIFLSKSIRIAVPFSIAFFIFLFILIFTNIGNGNQQVRRMRSAFNKSDASANVRDMNKESMKKYIKDAPWGIGLGMGASNVPANNKYTVLANIPPDSEYVFIWLRTGSIGITIFVLTTMLMLGGACLIVLFRLKNRSLIGIGAGFCCAFVSIHLGGYANQVLMQFPNCLIFYGGLSIVYILPHIEPAWIEYENNLLAELERKKRLKKEKKLASRV